MCGDANTTRDIVDCVEKKTFAPEDAVINAFRGFTVPTADLTEPWQEKDFDLTFTFHLFSPLLNFYPFFTAGIGLLKKELRLSVFLHQPGFFL